MALFSRPGEIAIAPPVVQKLEGKLENGIARITQRVNLVEATVLMHAKLANGQELAPGDKLILRGDIIMQQWAKAVFVYNGTEMVFCSEGAISGYNRRDG